jgi:hypothetical protein
MPTPTYARRSKSSARGASIFVLMSSVPSRDSPLQKSHEQLLSLFPQSQEQPKKEQRTSVFLIERFETMWKRWKARAVSCHPYYHPNRSERKEILLQLPGRRGNSFFYYSYVWSTLHPPAQTPSHPLDHATEVSAIRTTPYDIQVVRDTPRRSAPRGTRPPAYAASAAAADARGAR